MQHIMLGAKIHRAKVTQCDVDYEGSIAIDTDLMSAAGMLVGEKVEIYNINNANRFATYTIPAKAGSGDIAINGAAAKLCQPGDLVIIVAYRILTPDEVKDHHPKVVLVDDNNHIKYVK